MARTTILLDDDLLLEVKQMARARGITVTEVVREALEASLKRQSRTPVLSFTGVGRSGRHSISKDAEKVLRRKLDRREGW
jgi:predicted DNA-binding ribbon-helix-helix protein